MVGSVSDLINATKVHLKLSTNLILLQELDFHIGRPEAREGADAGSLYFYGHGDNYFEATILLSGSEVETFTDYTILTADGALPENTFSLIYDDIGGATNTIAVKAVVPTLDFNKPIEGGVKARVRFRITQEVTASDVTQS